MQTVIFDMDGVIIDSEPFYRRVETEFFAHKGVPVQAEQLDQFIGAPSRAYWQGIGHMFPDWDADALRAEYKIFRTQYPCAYRDMLNPGVIPLLESLKAHGVMTAVASSSSVGTIQKVLADCGIARYYDVIAGGDEVPLGKPDPGVFLLAARRLHASPRDCVVIEDSGNGILAAKAAGMKVIAKRHPDFAQDISGADAQVLSLEEVSLSLIESMLK